MLANGIIVTSLSPNTALILERTGVLIVIGWCFDYHICIVCTYCSQEWSCTYLFDANAKVSRSKMIWAQRLRLLESSLS